MKVKTASLIAVPVIGIALAFGIPQAAQATGTDQVAVCKYDSKPGAHEVLKGGKNPIVVSVSTLKGFTGTFPYPFTDAQLLSIAIGYETPTVHWTVANCPGYVVPTSTVTATKTVTATATQTVTATATTTVTGPTVKVTETLPAHTITVTAPASTVTLPGETATATVTATATQTVMEPGATTTITQPQETATATVTATETRTVTGPTTTATETVTGPTKTVTETAPCVVPTATVTVTASPKATQPAGILASTGSTVQNWIFFVTLAVFLSGLGLIALGRKRAQ